MLTLRALELAGTDLGGVILDVGCGPGGNAELLRKHSNRVLGLDVDPDLLLEAKKAGMTVLRGDMTTLPLSDSSVDTILCECAWNLTRKTSTLCEFRRVLRAGGTLILSDLYLREPSGDSGGKSWPVASCFSQATSLARVQEMVELAGFKVKVLEDHVQLFKRTAAEFVFAHGSLKKFWSAVLGDEGLAGEVCSLAAKTRPSLFLLTATRWTQ